MRPVDTPGNTSGKLITRRTFVSSLGGLAVAGLTGGIIANNFMSKHSFVEQVTLNDGDIEAGYLIFDSPYGNGEGRGYLARPSQVKGKLPAVLLAHGSSGLNPHAEAVTRDLAREGYLVFAPDTLHTVGGYSGDDNADRLLLKSMNRNKVEQDFVTAATILKNHVLANGKLGVVGFCFGGYISNMLAAMPELIDASVPFYGMPAKNEQADKIKGPLLLQFAERDEWVNGSWAAYEAVLLTNQADYQAFTYPGVSYDFHDDTCIRYDKAAAELAWQRTLAFFEQHLRG